MKRKVMFSILASICVSMALTGCSCEHNWSESTCTIPKTCALCNETEGSVSEHNMIIEDGIYRCKVCGEYGGEAFVRLSTDKADAIMDEEFEKIKGFITSLSDILDYYKNHNFNTTDDIHTFEAKWEELHITAETVCETLTLNRPPIEYDELWLEMRDCAQEISSIFAKGTNMDANGDGQYDGNEMKDYIVDLSDKLIVQFQLAISIAEEINDLPPINNSVSEAIESTSPPKNENSSSSTQNKGNSCTVCGKQASKTYTNPFSKKAEYYCTTHYNELQNMEDDLKESLSGNNGNSSNSSSYESPYNSARHTDQEAWVCAQMIAKDNLKSPSTAKFCKYPEATVTHLGNGEYMVVGWVDAQNSFGATLRSTFVVTYTATKDGYKNASVAFS